MQLRLPIAAFVFFLSLASVVHAGGDFGGDIPLPPVSIGGTFEDGKLNQTNTGVRLEGSIGSESVFDGGTIQAYVSLDSDDTNLLPVGTPFPITNADLNTSKTIDLTVADVLSALQNEYPGFIFTDGT